MLQRLDKRPHRRSTLRFYWALYKSALQARAEYRADFIIAIATALMTQLSALSFYWVLFATVPALGGWPPAGVLFLFAMSALVLGVSELCLNGIWSLPSYIVGGDLDRLLLYPVRPLHFLLLARPELHAVGNLATGAVLLGVCWSRAALPSWALLLVPIWVVSGALIYNAALVLVSCLSFQMVGPWTQQFTSIHHLLHAARYPANVFPRWLELVLLTLFPIGLATFVPGQWLFQQAALWPALVAPPVAAALATTVSHRAWGGALRRYESTGS